MVVTVVNAGWRSVLRPARLRPAILRTFMGGRHNSPESQLQDFRDRFLRVCPQQARREFHRDNRPGLPVLLESLCARCQSDRAVRR